MLFVNQKLMALMLLSVIAAPYGCNLGTAIQRPLSQPPTQETTNSNKQTTPKASVTPTPTNHLGDTTIIQESIQLNNDEEDDDKIELNNKNHIRSIKKNKIEPVKNGPTVQSTGEDDDDEIEPVKNDPTVQSTGEDDDDEIEPVKNDSVQSNNKNDEIQPAKGEEKNKTGFFKRLFKRKNKKDK